MGISSSQSRAGANNFKSEYVTIPSRVELATPESTEPPPEEAYSRVRTEMSQKLDRQKDTYDEKVHGVPFKQNDLVWLHSTVVPRSCRRKLHRSWTGPFKVVKQLADSVYHLQNVLLRRLRPVVHFNRLKPCPDDISMPCTLPVSTSNNKI